MKKIIISFVTGLVIMFGATVFAITTSFPDVNPSDWYFEDVMTLASWDVIRGYPDGTFKGGDPTNRAETSAIVVRYDKHVDSKISDALNEFKETELGDTISEEFNESVFPIINEMKAELGELYYLHALHMVDLAAMYYNHAWNESIFKSYDFEISCDKFDPLRNTAFNYLTDAKNYIAVNADDENFILNQIDSYKDLCNQL